MKKFRFLLFAIVLFSLTSFSFSEEINISKFTQQKINEFIDLRVELKSSPHAEAVAKIAEVWEATFSELKENALDYEQESILLEGLYFMETYERSVTKNNRAELRAKMKSIMLRGFDFIDKTNKKNINSNFYAILGDVTSYYMTRSVSATFYYGMKVKSLYETAIEKNPTISGANVSLGNWYFYAPGILGGSNKKAEKCYKTAIKGSVGNGDRFLAYEFLSQLYFEQKKYDLCKEYLAKARELGIGGGELDIVENCNKKKISLYQYNRNKAGIDEEIPENEKDEEDKKK